MPCLLLPVLASNFLAYLYYTTPCISESIIYENALLINPCLKLL
ncbi:hypothetical protein Dm11a5_1517 [Dehalococcoides mccartyi]|uniref:Uncharacterized protein n=1 Tax=Dehalococcoides mccartyi TaxID=61435 RepID=A0A142VBX9_9CHLR|nr:hypothetical protein Dm11a5_1517 [Dehalococcoides mccartyi]